MFRRNPDALALLAIGLVMLGVNAPRLILRRASWQVTPVKVELLAEREQMKLVRQEILSHRAELKRAAESIRESVRP